MNCLEKGTKILLALMQLDIGGAETHVVELAKELKKRGYEVFVASKGGSYEKEISEAGITHFTVPLQNKNPLNVFKSYKFLKSIIVDNKIDIVHSHARIPSFILGKIWKKLKFPFVTTAHWVFTTKYGLKYITDWGQKTVAVSEDIKKYLMDNYGIPESDIFVTINGIDIEKFSPDTPCGDLKAEFGIKEDDFCICAVSRMDEDRSLASKLLIEKAPELKKIIPNLKVLVAGGGNDEESAKALAAAANKETGENTVILTGARTDINKIVACGDLFVGVSRAALEAMAAEKNTIIAGNEGFIGLFDESKLEVGIKTNFCCRECRETTGEAIYNDIVAYYNKTDEEKKSLGRYCRKIVKEYYSVSKMADDCVAAYESAIECGAFEVKKDILISGYYGFGNSGDDALLLSMIRDFESKGLKKNITVLSANPKETKRIYGVNAINRINPFALFYYFVKCRLFISGGGTLIQDGTSTKSLIYYLWLIKSAKLLGRKTMLYANGIGPVNRDRNKARVKKVLNRVDCITVRDEKSLKELTALGVDKPEIILTADPAFLLDCEENIDALVQKYQLDNIICAAIRSPKTDNPGFAEGIAAALDRAAEKYGTMAVLLPMQNIDINISKEISSAMKSRSVVIDERLSVGEVLSLVGMSRMCIGMRLHMLIYAASKGVPVTAIVYDPKVSGFMEYSGQDLFVDVKEVNNTNLAELVDRCLSEEEERREKLSCVKDTLSTRAALNLEAALDLYKKEN